MKIGSSEPFRIKCNGISGAHSFFRVIRFLFILLVQHFQNDIIHTALFRYSYHAMRTLLRLFP